jgi:TonB-linked SusC/RagA family outer membrane protein
MLAAALVAVVPGLARAQAAQGSIAGRVTDKTTGQPIASVQVTIGGTTRGTVTSADGRFRIDNVNRGPVEVRARFIGYGVGSATVTVVGGETATADFALTANPVGLDAVVVTASGERQTARQIPNAVAQINFDDINQTGTPSFSEALNARAAGVTVQVSSGTTGGGTRVRIRGSNSVSLSNEPVYYVDGVRVESGAGSNTIGVGGQTPSRINDINPEDIESIEIIKGPSAAALYGTAAANGIVQIRTKRGRAGPTSWTAFTEGGSLSSFTTFPNNYFGFDTTKSLAIDSQAPFRFGCNLQNVAAKACSQNGGIVTLNPLRDDSPYRTGSRQQYGLSLSGGNEQTTFYIGGDFEGENGVLPNNSLQRTNLRANLHNQVRRGLDVAVNTAYSSSRLKLPDNDNNSLGYLGSGLLGSARTKNGWGFQQPVEVRSIQTGQGVERFTGGLTANAQPYPWLSARWVVGLDVTNRSDTRTVFPNTVLTATQIGGLRVSDPVQIYDYTSNFSVTARRDLSSAISSSTTAGIQWFRERAQFVFASGQPLAAGTGSLAGIGVPSASEDINEARTLGLFVEEQLGLRDRLYVNVAVRADKNSAFGKSFGRIVYPKVGASWVVSEEPFFPQTGSISNLRLRAAYGQSGLQPGVTDALQFYTPVVVVANAVDVPAFTFGNLGNVALKPERTAETEVGFDADLADERVHVEFTYYNKNSRDALISRPLAPSIGTSAAQFYNLGKVRNQGVEVALSGQFINTPAAHWDFTLSVFGNRNRLIDLGKDFLGKDIPTIVFGDQRHAEGYPLGGYWERKILGFNDANGDGILVPSEIQLAGPTNFSYIGTPFPTQGASLSTGLTWHNRFRISTLLDYRGGNKNFNLTEQFRCNAPFFECQAFVDPKTPLDKQAEAVAGSLRGDPIGYIEDASFLKVREIQLTYYAPPAVAGRFGAKTMSVTVAGRNLATWTKYTGFDPELSGSGQTNFTTRDFLTQPPVRYFTARVNFTF